MHAQTREGAPPFPNYRVNFIAEPMRRIRFLVPGPGTMGFRCTSVYRSLGLPSFCRSVPIEQHRYWFTKFVGDYWKLPRRWSDIFPACPPVRLSQLPSFDSSIRIGGGISHDELENA